MKKYTKFLESLISETTELIIHNIPYYDITGLSELKNIKIDKSFKDQWGFRYEDYLNMFKKNKDQFSDPKYQFLIGIRNEELVSMFYKKVGEEKDKYGDGYIISSQKGNANKMFLEMKKYGSFTTFSNLENIASIKSQLKIDAEILCLSSNTPNKNLDGTYDPNITDPKLIKLIQDKKIFFKDTYTNEEFFFMNDKNEIKISKLKEYLMGNNDIKLVYPKKDFKKDERTEETQTGLKLYFYHS